MLIVRFESTENKICYGSLPAVPDGDKISHVQLIQGDIFDKFTVSDKQAEVKRLLAPVDPPNVLALGLNYRQHAEESNMQLPSQPLIFIKATTSIIAPFEPIVLPASAPNEVDFEAELAVIIGKKCKNISESDAGDYILGYTCGNDVTARDCQVRIDKQWARAKSFDTFCPLGPWIVTADAMDSSKLSIKCIVSDQVMQDSNTDQMVFNVPQIVSYLSKQFTLLPGTVIMTGTPHGIGFARKPQRFLRSGDRVTVQIEQIGQLCNPVADA